MPSFILPSELQQYGLPLPTQQADIYNLVQLASTLIDTACGRIDGDGNGSLVYTTYTQRTLLSTRNRNVVQLSAKPIVALTQTQIDNYQNMAATGTFNCYYTGALQASTSTSFEGVGLVGIVSCSGRYGYTRQDMSVAYPDLWAFINPLNLITLFGGPSPWVAIDPSQIDVDIRTGEIWIPAGLQLQRYSEILVTYTSGYPPDNMPPAVKFVCAAIVKNALARGDATTGLMSMNIGRSGAGMSFYEGGLIDPTLDVMLQPYKVVRGI